MYRISPHSTGPYPLLRPLPKKGRERESLSVFNAPLFGLENHLPHTVEVNVDLVVFLSAILGYAGENINILAFAVVLLLAKMMEWAGGW